MDLFRGKTQSIVSNLAQNARYEIRTPTAVAGVRGTNFIAFFLNGVSGFIPKVGTIYGFNRNMPKDVKVIRPGRAIFVMGFNQPPTEQPATSGEVDKHIADTEPKQEAGGTTAETTTATTTETTTATTTETTAETTVATTAPTDRKSVV